MLKQNMWFSYLSSSLKEYKNDNTLISLSVQNTTIRPSVSSDAGMAKEFPVSSGSQHRKKVWIDL